MKKYALLDAEDRAARISTFEMPPKNLREGLVRVGDVVKAIFYEDEPPQSERMWVLVTEVAGAGRYVGTLNNAPFGLRTVEFGDRVEVEARHICAWRPTKFSPEGDGSDEVPDPERVLQQRTTH